MEPRVACSWKEAAFAHMLDGADKRAAGERKRDESDPSGTSWRARSIEARGYRSHRGAWTGPGGSARSGGRGEFYGHKPAARKQSAPSAVHAVLRKNRLSGISGP